VAWSAGAEYIASGSEDKTIQVWDAGQGTWLYTFQGYTSPVTAVAWCVQNIAFAGKNDGSIQLWDISNNQSVTTQAQNGRVVALSTAWGWLISGREDGVVQSWRAGSFNTVVLSTTYTGHTEPVRAVAANPTQIILPQGPNTGVTLIASGGVDRTVQIWEAQSGRSIIKYEGHTASISALAWNQYTQDRGTIGNEPVGTIIASTSDDGTVHIWRVADGKLLTKYGQHTGKVNAVAWFFNNQQIVSGGDDKTVQVWDPQTGRLIQKYKFPASVRSIACDPIYSSRFVAALDDGTVHLQMVSI
jgi:WD40 repeat protein